MKLLVTPIDTWFFRDSTPFDMEAAPQAGVRGVFPPSPATVTGTVRAALARVNGWNGRGDWNDELKAILGDGPDDLGCLALTGPFVVRNGEPIFSLPRHVAGRRDANGTWTASTMIRAGTDGVACDLGETVRLPELSGTDSANAERVEHVAGNWITLGGLRRILAGELPEEKQIVASEKVWHEESRVGIRRNPDTRTTDEGALYSTRHARPEASIGIAVEVTGVPENWALPNSIIPFGGESRCAACEEWDCEIDLKLVQAPMDRQSFALIALTPALIHADVLCGRAPLSEQWPAHVVCACADRPLRIGGWDSLKRAPLRLKNALAPGSVLFCKGEEPPDDDYKRRGLLRLGSRQPLGFGLFAIGVMPKEGA
ncbi:MAG: type III-B CRISPR module-associated protein Cmr3 [Candidatus Binataceae bacterium]